MRNKNIILGIGISMIILPSLGLPSFWKNFFVIVLGIWICVLFIFERKRKYSVNLNNNEHFKKIDSAETGSVDSEDLKVSEDLIKLNDKTSQA